MGLAAVSRAGVGGAAALAALRRSSYAGVFHALRKHDADVAAKALRGKKT